MSELVDRYRFLRYVYGEAETSQFSRGGMESYALAWDKLLRRRVAFSLDRWYKVLKEEKILKEDDDDSGGIRPD